MLQWGRAMNGAEMNQRVIDIDGPVALQWGRAMNGAEIQNIHHLKRASDISLQWGRAMNGAEIPIVPEMRSE